jgi:DNA-directed RNA polymerase specialized sigma24 family protein
VNASLDQQFETIYRAHVRQMTGYVASRLFRPDAQLAEDLTAETFLRLWQTLSGGTQVDQPRALLNLIAERTIADHFRRRSSRESATDFAVSNLTEVASGAAFSPHLASLLADLEQAKDELSTAADTYRASTREYVTANLASTSATRPEAVARAEARKAAAVTARQEALNAFTAAGRAVAAARAAWNEGADGLHGLTATAPSDVAGVVSGR